MELVYGYGETVQNQIKIQDATIAAGDFALVVIRDRRGTALWSHAYELAEEPVEGDTSKWVFAIEISHEDAERLLPVGTHSWGLAIYRNPTEFQGNIPTNGVVTIPIKKATFRVAETTAREDGIL